MRIIKKTLGDDMFIFFEDNHINCGYVQYHISYEIREVQLLYIYVHPDHRGKKYGHFLMEQMTQDVIDKMRNNNIDQFDIHLDDMTDNFGKSNNLYLKMGFEYCEVDDQGPCGPEMSKTIRCKI